MHFVYIIQSQVDGSYYIGETKDVALRVQRHNEGWSRSTKGKRPWNVIYIERYPTRKDALRREREIKKLEEQKTHRTVDSVRAAPCHG